MTITFDLPQEQVDEIARRAAELRPGATRRRLLSVAEAAIYMGRSEDAIRALVKKGHVPVVRTDGRVMIDVPDLDRLIEESKTTGRG